MDYNIVVLGEKVKLDNFSKKEWLDYTNRLQDRERAKIVSSGLTFWILISIVGSITYFLVKNFEEIQSDYNTFLIIMVLFFNLYPTIFDLFNSTIRVKKIFKYNVVKKGNIGYRHVVIWKVFEFLLLSIGLIGNIFIIVTINSSNVKLFYCIFVIYYFLALRTGVLEIWENYNEKCIKNQRIREGIKFIRLASIFMVAISFLQFFIMFRYKYISVSKNILYGFDLFLIIAVTVNILIYMLKRTRISWLEDFEEEIIRENLRASQIKKRFINQYLNSGKIDDFF